MTLLKILFDFTSVFFFFIKLHLLLQFRTAKIRAGLGWLVIKLMELEELLHSLGSH